MSQKWLSEYDGTICDRVSHHDMKPNKTSVEFTYRRNITVKIFELKLLGGRRSASLVVLRGVYHIPGFFVFPWPIHEQCGETESVIKSASNIRTRTLSAVMVFLVHIKSATRFPSLHLLLSHVGHFIDNTPGSRRHSTES